ncbi:MAG: DUF3299 domain-containing protein [Halioglobus sp.]
MRQLVVLYTCIAMAWLPATYALAKDSTSADASELEFRTIGWTDLIPPEILQILENPPDYITDILDGSAEDQISDEISNSIGAGNDDLYQQALVSTKVRGEMDGAKIRLPGFIVPLEFDEEQTITQFFLVPYFGACLHMPPPPPNQIVLVDYPQGLQLQELYTPFWILGEISTTVSENDMATSAYSMKMMEYEPYEE